GLLADLAAEELAVAAIHAVVDGRPVLVGVRPRQRAGRRGKGLVAELLRRLLEERAGEGSLERRIRIFARARALEWIAAGNDLALDVARLAADAVQVLETDEVPLQLVVGEARRLARAVCRAL